MMKFPKSVSLRTMPDATTDGNIMWDVVSRRGETVLCYGKSASKAQARSDAWHALEEMGLVTDGDDS